MSVALLVFAKAPVPGECKTRLAPALGEAGAARLYRAFLEDVLRVGADAGFALELWCAGDLRHRDLAELSARFSADRRAQPQGDLGARMTVALGDALARHERALLVGSDLPTLPARLLRAAADGLDEAPSVFGPSGDGGYWIVGARGAVPAFPNVRWSTRHALADSLAGNPEATLVEPWYDVDAPDDLEVLKAHLGVDPEVAPATRAAMDALGR
ncbi:MAG: TIGR04282 family arsenosugar biosynthesis glycosyltransferase [Myxococcota bacterium]